MNMEKYKSLWCTFILNLGFRTSMYINRMYPDEQWTIRGSVRRYRYDRYDFCWSPYIELGLDHIWFWSSFFMTQYLKLQYWEVFAGSQLCNSAHQVSNNTICRFCFNAKKLNSSGVRLKNWTERMSSGWSLYSKSSRA